MDVMLNGYWFAVHIPEVVWLFFEKTIRMDRRTGGLTDLDSRNSRSLIKDNVNEQILRGYNRCILDVTSNPICILTSL